MIKNRQGFTFIELLVVVTIIGVLTAVGVVSYTSTNQSARDSKRLADLEQIRSALEICRSEAGSYPADVSSGVVCDGDSYLSPLPSDPWDSKSGYGYSYTQNSPTSYDICATLENDDKCTGTISGTGECCLSNP